MAQGATIHIHPAFFGPFSGLPRKGVTNHVWRPHGRNDVDEAVVKIDWAVSAIIWQCDDPGQSPSACGHIAFVCLASNSIRIFMNNRDAE